MNLQPLVVPAANPAEILDDLERAISGECALLPLPSEDPGRARVLRDSQRAGEPIEDTALVLCTSGSTGEPKGAMLSPRNLVSSADATHAFLGGAGQWLLALPGHHVAGIQVLIRSIIAGVDPLCLDLRHGFSIPAFVSATRELKETGDRVYTSLVPNQLVKAMSTLDGIEALRLFDAILVGGAAVGGDTLRAAREMGINVVTTYGSSETSGGCVYNGRPIRGASVRVLTSGLIELGGPMVAAGYRNFPAAEAFATPGWFRTSDLGVLSESGELTVLGRADNVIITGGLKILPEVVEQALLNVRGVREACVFGVPDERLGQRIVAVYAGTLTPGEVISELDGLQRWQLPRELRRVDALPLIGPGKVDMRAVETMFMRGV